MSLPHVSQYLIDCRAQVRLNAVDCTMCVTSLPMGSAPWPISLSSPLLQPMGARESLHANSTAARAARLMARLRRIVTTHTPVMASAVSRIGAKSYSTGRIRRPDMRNTTMPVASTATRWLRHMERSTRANDWIGRADSEGRRAWWDDID
jgi:hypothetical protein